ncbi:uncharacterized protein LOC142892628 [Nelusetta ayraudi]|uniref:uncharacterized protein LOC142892628 n=1 Tax=Nelusetta ayraudi TaxID=303726 RepID=UPI003F7191FA
MDGEILSLSSSTSLSSVAEGQKDVLPKGASSSFTQVQERPKSAEQLWTGDASPTGNRLLSTEEQVTLITESMTVTSGDQEKLLLLNKNTELRRVNKELMKLNEEWDQVYHNATMRLQHRMEALELENAAIKQLNSRLLLKVEHQQSAKEYYEQALMQELKKNQELQEYLRLLENKIHQPKREGAADKQANSAGVIPCIDVNPAGGPNLLPSHAMGYGPLSCFSPPSPNPEAGWREEEQGGGGGGGGGGGARQGASGDSRQEVQDLKEQLEALRCQTQIYEEEYETEHNDHKHTLQENRRLRKKREEMRQQVALLQEQLRVYEDDFRRERSDKQMLQRLLLKKTPPNKSPVLLHRCNNDQQPIEGDKLTQSGEKRKHRHLLCLKHQNTDTVSD